MSDTVKILKLWTGGENGLGHPADIRPDQYARGENIFNRGGIVQTRAGYEYKAAIAGARLQGMGIFTPDDSRPLMIVAVDGKIFRASPPFVNFTQINGIAFRADAPQICMVPVLKSVENHPDGRIELVNPKRYLIIQDGSTKPALYDGVVAKHAEPLLDQIPVGLWMAWTASRLWVANKTQVKVSDIANPLSFTENEYLAERSNFELPGDCTGMIETTDKNGLLVFSENTTTAFKSAVRDRAAWASTPDFQKVILPQCGCVSGFSPVNQYGKTWWYSKKGLTSLDGAMFAEQSSELASEDALMMRTRRVLSPDLSGVATCEVENLLLVSVPAGSRWNAETMVLDQTPTGQSDGNARSWCGAWTGARPVQWAKTRTGGRERVYFAAYDATAKEGSKIHIWEAFRLERTDNGGRISCQFETRAETMTGALERIKYAELDLCEIYGDVELTVYAGGIRGPWIKILEKTLRAKIGCFGPELITKTSLIRAYKKQTRTVRTQEFSGLQANASHGENPESGTDTVGHDKSFSLLVEWRGQMGIREIRLVSSRASEQAQGKSAMDETLSIAVSDAGERIDP